MSRPPLSAYQREILDALATGWELCRWWCDDGRHRWHLGEDEIDGRSVEGLLRRGMVAGRQPSRFPWLELMLTEKGREAIR